MWETTFTYDEERGLAYHSACEYEAGQITGADVPDIHQLGNPDVSERNLVTIHYLLTALWACCIPTNPAARRSICILLTNPTRKEVSSLESRVWSLESGSLESGVLGSRYDPPTPLEPCT